MAVVQVRSAVGVAQVPDATIARAGMAADDADRFSIEVPEVRRSALAWARTVLEETEAGRSAPRFWTAIGVRLGPRPSPDHVQGWSILDQQESWVVLGSRTPYLEARAVVEVEGATVSVALVVHFRLPLVGRAAWWPISILHRRGVPVMLRQARRVAVTGHGDITVIDVTPGVGGQVGGASPPSIRAKASASKVG
jgi:hypothetical protein